MELRIIANKIKKISGSKFVIDWRSFFNNRKEREKLGIALIEEMRAMDFQDNQIEKEVKSILNQIEVGAINYLRKSGK